MSDANPKVNILLVDDQPGKLLSYEVILEELGENLIMANSALEALEHLLKTDVAVVLVDACMPEMDGFELAEMIRKHPRCEKTAIILVSAVYLSDFDRLRGYGVGAVDYVPVPVVPELLRAKVGVFAELYRKTEQLSRLNAELERRVGERTAALEASTAELRQSEAKFRRTFECNMIPMGVWGNDGAVTEANDALLHLIGYKREDLAAGLVRRTAILPPADAPLHELFWDEVLAQGVGSPHERMLIDRSGRRIPVLFGGAAFDLPASHGVFFAFDLSERKQGEEDRMRLLESERQARATAEQANRLKDDFLATLSHELRTPINAVLGWVQLMSRGALDAPSTEEGLRVIERGVRTQVRLIDELLDVNRISSGKFRIIEDRVELGQVLNGAIETVLPEVHQKGISMSRDGDSTGILLRGDATRLQQVFWNLLTNATKFTPQGGRIGIRVDQNGSSVRVTVSDTGKGIPTDLIPHIFDRFRQGDSSITRRQGGLGLGLAIAKHIIEMHRGSIEAFSDGEGHGAQFTVCLPVEATGHAPDVLPGGSPDLAGVRVLVVEDDAATREIICRILKEYAAETHAVASADEALRAFMEWRPDVLVCDIGIPEKDGYALISEFRSMAHCAGVPALALTAYTRLEDRARALAAGYNAHLPKPINPHHLVLTISDLVSNRVTP